MSIDNIHGTFDVHITVDENDIYKFNQYCIFKGIAIAYAVGPHGNHKQQLMTSGYVQNKSSKEAIADAHKLAQELQKADIKVLRIKIEAMSEAKGVAEFIKTSEYAKHIEYYFEFHWKITLKTLEHQKKLEQLCVQNNASYALNFLSQNRKDPLIAFRVKAKTIAEAHKARDRVMEQCIALDLAILDKGRHNEFIIYDTNYSLDKNFVPDPLNLL